MKVIKCDECKTEMHENLADKEYIHLQGFKGRGTSGLLLPERFTSVDFCSRECFIQWVNKQIASETP